MASESVYIRANSNSCDINIKKCVLTTPPCIVDSKLEPCMKGAWSSRSSLKLAKCIPEKALEGGLFWAFVQY